MKKKIFAAISLALLLSFSFCFSVAAEKTASFEDYGISVSLPDSYILLTESNLSKNTEDIEKLGYSETSIKKFMTDGGIIFIAAGADNTEQIQLKRKKTEFTSEVMNLSELSDSDIKALGKDLVGDTFTVITSDGIPFYKTSGADSTQYITVKNGYLFSLVYYGSSSSGAATAFGGLHFSEKSKVTVSDGNIILGSIINIALIVLALVAIVFIIITFINDKRRKSQDFNDVSDYIKIRRRKF